MYKIFQVNNFQLRCSHLKFFNAKHFQITVSIMGDIAGMFTHQFTFTIH